MIKVAMVEDHVILAEGLRSLLARADGIQVVTILRDAETAVEWLSQNTCDVLLLDISLPVRDGFWLLETLGNKGKLPPTLVLTMHKDNDIILRAMDLGAAGYLVKSVAADELARAIATVAAGSSYGDHHVKQAVAAKLKGGGAQAPGAVTLSDREKQILVMLAQGQTNIDIADRLSVSKSTVKTHIRALYLKLGVEDRTGATLYAIRHRYVPMPSDTSL